MLIITRRPGEKLMVGDDVVVQVMEIVGGTVRIGIDAPRSVPVYREEIFAAVREENRAAAEAGPSLPEPELPPRPTGTVR
jgi:carbon storage regulator